MGNVCIGGGSEIASSAVRLRSECMAVAVAEEEAEND